MSIEPMNTEPMTTLIADPALPALDELMSIGAELVSHKRGRRAVVRMQTGSGTQFIKVVRPGKAAKILDGIRRAEPFNGPFRTPEVLQSTDSTVTFAELTGLSLHSPEQLSQDQWVQAWTQVAASLAQVIRTGLPQDQPAPLVHSAEAEVRVLRQWFQRSAEQLPQAARTQQQLTKLASQLEQISTPRMSPTHRDLHDKQLLWSAVAGPGLLDVDTACAADPALDLGNLRAHALLRRLQGLWSAAEAETVQFSLDHCAEETSVPRESVAVYERAALLRLSMVYALRPQHSTVAEELTQLV